MRLHQGILDSDFLPITRKRTFQKASLLKRFLNLLIDYMAILHLSILVGVLLGMVFVVLGKNELVNVFKNPYVSIAISGIVIFLYYFLCELFLKGKTLGKFATKTSVRNTSGERASSKEILIRSATRLIPLEPVSIFLGKDKAWHDDFSSTIVVDDF